ncbi:hypothetical protein VTK73DRAFT_4554 [Phialemonium thermophilum]|uniref:Uncharacterized protein n=1 Tax=Phialemonium thermophilum TaxID=223376 RepID=A0ABR3V9J7_9PEZI
MAMAAGVEARSLAELNDLAANPPQYPTNPTEEPRNPLVLYIMRVPGSRDVILSPFKPQPKNVTGEDVSHSLYYVHLDDPSDEQFLPPGVPDEEGPQRPSLEAIPRKPLPPNAKVPGLAKAASDRQAMAPSPPPAAQQLREGERGGIRQPPDDDPDARGIQLQPKPEAATPPVRRKPLGPRPLEEAPPVPDKDRSTPARPASSSQPSLFRDHLDATSIAYTSPQPPPPPPPPPHGLSRSLSPKRPPFPSFPARSPSPVKSQSRRPSFAPFSLTLIRRDPSTGHQWNIAKISSFQTNIPTPDAADPDLGPETMSNPHGQPAIDIHIETSGYAKFRGMPTRESLDAFRAGMGAFVGNTAAAAGGA